MPYSAVLVGEVSLEASCRVARTLGGMKVSKTLNCRSYAPKLHPTKVPVVALETIGSNCFYNAIAINTQSFTSRVPTIPSTDIEDNPLYTIEVVDEDNVAIPHMKSLKSRAASLGATSPAPGVVRMALDRAGGVRCVCIPDKMAMHCARLFAGESPCDAKR
jgi:hypothetical protein